MLLTGEVEEEVPSAAELRRRLTDMLSDPPKTFRLVIGAGLDFETKRSHEHRWIRVIRLSSEPIVHPKKRLTGPSTTKK